MVSYPFHGSSFLFRFGFTRSRMPVQQTTIRKVSTPTLAHRRHLHKLRTHAHVRTRILEPTRYRVPAAPTMHIHTVFRHIGDNKFTTTRPLQNRTNLQEPSIFISQRTNTPYAMSAYTSTLKQKPTISSTIFVRLRD